MRLIDQLSIIYQANQFTFNLINPLQVAVPLEWGRPVVASQPHALVSLCWFPQPAVTREPEAQDTVSGRHCRAPAATWPKIAVLNAFESQCKVREQ